MAAPLPESEVRNALASLSGWIVAGNAIQRVFEFATFAEAMTFVNKVAEAAEAANHHPDITINYNKVTMSLTSHDSGGVTKRDLRMAQTINTVAGR